MSEVVLPAPSPSTGTGSVIFLAGFAVLLVLAFVFGLATGSIQGWDVAVLGLALFTAGSGVAATAETMMSLVFGRALQGCGAVAGVTLAFAADHTHPERRSTVMALIGMVYALHVKRPGEHVAAFVYIGSALGVVVAGDYLTLFVFWEGMAFASAYLVFAQGGAAAVRAGFRYLMVHVTGGVVLLGGVVLYGWTTGSLLFGPIEGDLGLAAYLILAGFMLNKPSPPT